MEHDPLAVVLRLPLRCGLVLKEPKGPAFAAKRELRSQGGPCEPFFQAVFGNLII